MKFATRHPPRCVYGLNQVCAFISAPAVLFTNCKPIEESPDGTTQA
jgi:hypothetical protein